MDDLTAISPIDGRYRKKLELLSEYFSEYALIRKRVLVELMYLIELGKADENILKLHEGFKLEEAKKVKEIEKETNHDVKAVEYYLKERVPDDVKEWVHFGLTSEDVNNLAYSLLIKDFMVRYTDKLDELIEMLREDARKYKAIAMLSHTHGQPASPTTLGKEMFVFCNRLKGQLQSLENIRSTGKLNGATGNYNAMHLVMPDKDWLEFSKNFIIKMGLEPNLVTTQVEPKDRLVELLHCVKRINSIIMDLDRDMWSYISFGYLRLKKKDSEVGSSTMPHKINPIDFENSEGNIKIANSLIAGMENLQVSRMQRDLSDSTMMRSIGVIFSHSYLAYGSAMAGLSKIMPDEAAIKKDLDSHPEILTEAVQTLLRSLGKKDGYERLKEFSRGKSITLGSLREFIKTLDIDEKAKERLLKLQPSDYIGLSADIVDKA